MKKNLLIACIASTQCVWDWNGTLFKKSTSSSLFCFISVINTHLPFYVLRSRECQWTWNCIYFNRIFSLFQPAKIELRQQKTSSSVCEHYLNEWRWQNDARCTGFAEMKATAMSHNSALKVVCGSIQMAFRNDICR